MRLCTGGGGLGTPATFVLAMAAVNGALVGKAFSRVKIYS